MDLDLIIVEPERFQFRAEPFSERTVEAIVDEGIDTARFDPIPVIPAGDGERWVVAGDGHSRFEAVCRLAERDLIPDAWRDGDGFDVPTREVEPGDALRLAYVANMSRSPFSACEEAGIFEARIAGGETVDEVAQSSHRSVAYVRRRMALTCLCETIREAVGEPWGIDVDKACVLAEACQRHGVDHGTQSELWHKVISKGDWTQRSLKLFMDRVAGGLSRSADGMLFDLPANISAVVAEVSAMAQQRRKARRGLQWLVAATDALDQFPELRKLIVERGAAMIERVKLAEQEDAEALGALVC